MHKVIDQERTVCQLSDEEPHQQARGTRSALKTSLPISLGETHTVLGLGAFPSLGLSSCTY